jgi:hypothetical protein
MSLLFLFFPYVIRRSLFVNFVPTLCRANTIVFIFDRHRVFVIIVNRHMQQSK